MSKAGPYLRKITGGYAHYCPGCKEMHTLPTEAPYHIHWAFNGDPDKPSFSPSFRHKLSRHGEADKICHYIITDGVLGYCDDSTHPLAGQHIPMVELDKVMIREVGD